MKHLTLNRVYALYILFFILVIFGVIPRWVVLFATCGVLAWMVVVDSVPATLFFLRCIPLFIAIPLTSSYDNLNMWRPLALVLFIKFLLAPQTRENVHTQFVLFKRDPRQWIKRHPVFRRLCILLLLAFLSLYGALHPITGLVRIIYFVNLSMVPVVVYSLIRNGHLTTQRIIRNLSLPVIIVIVFGFIQLASTYFMDIYQFMRLWGEGVQQRQFGTQWSYIAVNVGNTWLAYYGNQLSLRVFSLFPDSHSFPTFVILGIPALFALSLKPILAKAQSSLRTLMNTLAALSIVWVPLGFLAAILSGTRGMWATSIGVITLVPVLWWFMRRLHVDVVRRRIFVYIASYLVLFFLLFSLAWPIFISPQFLVGKGDFGLFAQRIRSVIDFGETSNALRLKIWKASLVSIGHHPLLGVGIGNFPVVLDQDIRLARAGSTAHNLYLHVAAEMGILAALEMIMLLVSVLMSCWRWFTRASGASMVYAGALLLYLPWILAYVLTDPIIFDERVFLFFATTLAVVWAGDHTTKTNHG